MPFFLPGNSKANRLFSVASSSIFSTRQIRCAKFMEKQFIKPDFLFESSWEVCNKVGSIHTVLATKALSTIRELGDRYILIGPDVWRDDSGVNPRFIEDPILYETWRQIALEEGLRVRMGRWNIFGKPMVMLVDFSHFIPQKDAIFADFWETYKLDSLSGQWDYIEPALFGYAAGRVIESFVREILAPKDKVVAQFHEWMTGTGLLYIEEKMPQIGTVFTTHATVLGRSLAGHCRPLYKNLEGYSPEDISREFNIVSKQSLESLSAKTADGFSTVSEITAGQCRHFLGKDPDLITPNGFENTFVPEGKAFDEKRNTARDRLTQVAEALFGYPLSKKTVFTAISGRYEYRSKGIDVFIDALGELNRSNDLKKEIVAFMLIPANHFGPRKDLMSKLRRKEAGSFLEKPFITHDLHDEQYDPILHNLQEKGLRNSREHKVKVVFIPSHLNGNDGIVDLDYYDALIGMDVTVFPSYYEPWGYAPLESLAFSVPTITSNLAGFGAWVRDHCRPSRNGITIIQRDDENDQRVVGEIVEALKKYTVLSPKEADAARKEAHEISRKALWENFLNYYFTLYSHALQITKGREHLFIGKEQTKQQLQFITRASIGKPQWNKLYVKTDLPERLAKLDDLSKNLWWSWNYEARELFETIDPRLWEKVEYNPVTLLESVDYQRYKELEQDKAFIRKLEEVTDRFEKYMNDKTEDSPRIAYVSMEYGLHNSLKIYSGGLGILAGDYLKEASDGNINMAAVGLLYKYGYFSQILTANGEQQAHYEKQEVAHLPLKQATDKDGNWITVNVIFPGYTLTARVWRVDVGRVPLYLLDADVEENSPTDRLVTHHLYGGDLENRLKQEMLLGIGGVALFHEIGFDAELYHFNEGHAAFSNLQRIRTLIRDKNLSFDVAKEIASASSLFTTHTPLPAGHDSFPEELLRIYLAHYPERLKISWDDLMGLGRYRPEDKDERFSMSVLAARLSNAMNGVSQVHGKVSRKMFADLWPGYLPEENHIDHVTNGVHYYTWTAKEWQEVYRKQFGEAFLEDQSNAVHWKKIHELPDEQVWGIKQRLKEKLIDNIKIGFRSGWINRHESPILILDITENLKKEALVIGFARRFATYKRADLLFNDLEILKRIVNIPDKPVLFLFAGKAHPHDKEGQELVRKIIEISKQPEFIGKILFLQNYEMSMAKLLVAGVDVWLNMPTRPLEASGTSGQKAAMNGTINFSVLDGWWVEGYLPHAGWSLPQEQTYDNKKFQNELDAETLYHVLENEIIKLYFKRNESNIPVEWVQYIKHTISDVAPKFTTKRMMDDYFAKFYHPIFERSKQLLENDFSRAKDLVLWKRTITDYWDDVEAVSYSFPENMKEGLKLGKKYTSEVQLKLNSLSPQEVGVELVIVSNSEGEEAKLIQKEAYSFVDTIDGMAVYRTVFIPYAPGSYDFGIRLFPKNKNLPHRTDCSHVKWI